MQKKRWRYVSYGLMGMGCSRRAQATGCLVGIVPGFLQLYDGSPIRRLGSHSCGRVMESLGAAGVTRCAEGQDKTHKCRKLS